MYEVYFTRMRCEIRESVFKFNIIEDEFYDVVEFDDPEIF